MQKKLEEDEMPPEMKDIRDRLTSFLRDILHNMMNYVSITSILQKILRDHGTDEVRA